MIDEFIKNIDVKTFSLKETINLFVLYKKEYELDEGITLPEVINVQTAYIDKLRTYIDFK